MVQSSSANVWGLHRPSNFLISNPARKRKASFVLLPPSGAKKEALALPARSEAGDVQGC
jgi:hypothetical protein